MVMMPEFRVWPRPVLVSVDPTSIAGKKPPSLSHAADASLLLPRAGVGCVDGRGQQRKEGDDLVTVDSPSTVGIRSRITYGRVKSTPQKLDRMIHRESNFIKSVTQILE